jgi:hypothetical protein
MPLRYPTATFCLSLVVSLAPAIRPSAAQTAPFTAADFQRLYSVVQAEGAQARMSPQGVSVVFGLQVADPLPCRELAADAGSRWVNACEYQARRYVVLQHLSGNDLYFFLIDEDGSLSLAVRGVVHTGYGGFRPFNLVEAQPLASEEEAYWLQLLPEVTRPAAGR